MRATGITSGRKCVHHPVVGQLDLDIESMALPAEPGLHLNVYTAPAGTPTADNLALVASWAATQQTWRPSSKHTTDSPPPSAVLASRSQRADVEVGLRVSIRAMLLADSMACRSW
ncbi:hypothetical protein KO481_16730 [Nocardia sp. NEAU-G5]|uniref:MmyB-like transcription regulator ligand binding domain-containing protein n=1 Tax=Nocardia albiluteola TaxID=2842303 RepID=A0ABS6AYP1_9NOCA|nr:hypothetical protein [Nocardia albiluteola]